MIIDLCCGIGRFPGVHTVSIDFDPKTRPTIIADISNLPLRPKLRPKLCHASPPCTYFSVARQRRYGHDHKGIANSLRLVAECFDIFHYLEAKNWTLENPVGFLSKILNETRISYEVHDYTAKRTVFYSNMRGLKRSIIPDNVRQMILDEVNRNDS